MGAGRERKRERKREGGRKGGRGERKREGRERERERERGGEKEGERERELTLHFTNFLATLIVASQKAPLYLALTSVPTVRNGGSSEVACKCIYI